MNTYQHAHAGVSADAMTTPVQVGRARGMSTYQHAHTGRHRCGRREVRLFKAKLLVLWGAGILKLLDIWVAGFVAAFQ